MKIGGGIQMDGGMSFFVGKKLGALSVESNSYLPSNRVAQTRIVHPQVADSAPFFFHRKSTGRPQVIHRILTDNFRIYDNGLGRQFTGFSTGNSQLLLQTILNVCNNKIKGLLGENG